MLKDNILNRFFNHWTTNPGIPFLRLDIHKTKQDSCISDFNFPTRHTHTPLLSQCRPHSLLFTPPNTLETLFTFSDIPLSNTHSFFSRSLFCNKLLESWEPQKFYYCCHLVFGNTFWLRLFDVGSAMIYLQAPGDYKASTSIFWGYRHLDCQPDYITVILSLQLLLTFSCSPAMILLLLTTVN